MSNNIAALIKETWSTNLQKHLRKEFVGQYITDYKFDGSFIGVDTINFPRQAKIVIGTLTSFNDSLTEQDITASNETFSLDQIRYFAFRLNIADDVETYINPKNQTYVDAKEGFLNEMDTAILGQYGNAGYVVDDGNMETATNAGAGNPVILSKDNIYDMFTAIGQVMDENYIPMNDRWTCISPAEKRLLNKSPFLTRSTSDGDSTVRRGFMGTIDDMSVLFSNNLTTATGTKHALAGQGKPICFASNIKPQIFVGTIDESLNFSYQVKGATKFGVKTFTEGSERLIDVQISA